MKRGGATYREVTEATGVPKQTVSAWIHDPDGSRSRARKDSYRGECARCGAVLSGGNGRGPSAPRHCAVCAPDANRTWTRDGVIAKIRTWVDLYGRPPSAPEWDPTPSRIADGSITEAARERYHSGEWPSSNTVIGLFGTWNAAIEAAGFEPVTGARWIRERSRDRQAA
jgi:hypothetical protein